MPCHSSVAGRRLRDAPDEPRSPRTRPRRRRVLRASLTAVKTRNSAEQVEDPAELVDRGGADRDEDAAHDQRQHDADQQRGLLDCGAPRTGHDDEEDEQVVDRQRVLGQPAGEELGAVLRARRSSRRRCRRRPPRRRRPARSRPTPSSDGSCGRRPITNTSKSRSADGDQRGWSTRPRSGRPVRAASRSAVGAGETSNLQGGTERRTEGAEPLLAAVQRGEHPRPCSVSATVCSECAARCRRRRRRSSRRRAPRSPHCPA